MWGGILSTGAKPGEPVGIIGIGGLGTLGVQFAKALGHPVVAIDNRSEGRALAEEMSLKADLILDYDDEKAVEKVKSWAGKGGLAGVVVCTDNVAATHWSLKLLRPLGVCVPLGLPVSGFEFDAFDTVFQAYTIKGSLVASISQIKDMMDTVAKYDVKSHITTVSLEKTPELPAMYMDPHLKGRLVMKISS